MVWIQALYAVEQTNETLKLCWDSYPIIWKHCWLTQLWVGCSTHKRTADPPPQALKLLDWLCHILDKRQLAKASWSTLKKPTAKTYRFIHAHFWSRTPRVELLRGPHLACRSQAADPCLETLATYLSEWFLRGRYLNKASSLHGSKWPSPTHKEAFQILCCIKAPHSFVSLVLKLT